MSILSNHGATTKSVSGSIAINCTSSEQQEAGSVAIHNCEVTRSTSLSMRTLSSSVLSKKTEHGTPANSASRISSVPSFGTTIISAPILSVVFLIPIFRLLINNVLKKNVADISTTKKDMKRVRNFLARKFRTAISTTLSFLSLLIPLS